MRCSLSAHSLQGRGCQVAASLVECESIRRDAALALFDSQRGAKESSRTAAAEGISAAQTERRQARGARAHRHQLQPQSAQCAAQEKGHGRATNAQAVDQATQLMFSAFSFDFAFLIQFKSIFHFGSRGATAVRMPSDCERLSADFERARAKDKVDL